MRTIDTSVYDYRQEQAEAERLQRVERARQKRAMRSLPPRAKHGASGYANYRCPCDICKQGHREYERQRRGHNPSPLAQQVKQLTDELDAVELNLEALRDENAMLRARLDELDT